MEVLVHQKFAPALAAEVDIKFLCASIPGYGNKGDRVEVVRTAGALSIIKIGMKKICIENKILSICPAHQYPQVLT